MVGLLHDILDRFYTDAKLTTTAKLTWAVKALLDQQDSAARAADAPRGQGVREAQNSLRGSAPCLAQRALAMRCGHGRARP